MGVRLRRLEPGQISLRQLYFLLFTFILATTDIYMPQIVALKAGRDAWLSVLAAALEGVAAVLVIIPLGLRFRRHTLIGIGRRVLGFWAGSLVGLFYLYNFVTHASRQVWHVSELMVTAFMPFTPKVVFMALTVLLAGYAVRTGLEAFTRVNDFLLPLGAAAVVLVGLLVAKEVDPRYYQPVLERGWRPVLDGSLPLFGHVAQGYIILMFLPFVRSTQGIYAWSFGTLGGLMVMMGVGLMAIGVFGVESTAGFTYPALELVRIINVREFVQHLESVMMLVWFGGIFVKYCILLYLSGLAAAELLGLRDYRPLVWPLGILSAALSLVTAQVQSVVEFFVKVFPGFALVLELAVPALLLGVAALRGVRDGGPRRRPGGT
ncbi:MAG: endospore germination permease [Firmicutes bacterium]|nr:endospore germination permease [Bacillota bacterium]